MNLIISRYDHPHIIAGQGTMGLEIVEQVENIDAVVIPVGGGGLIAGVSLAVKALYPHIQVIVSYIFCASLANKANCIIFKGLLERDLIRHALNDNKEFKI